MSEAETAAGVDVGPQDGAAPDVEALDSEVLEVEDAGEPEETEDE